MGNLTFKNSGTRQEQTFKTPGASYSRVGHFRQNKFYMLCVDFGKQAFEKNEEKK